MTEPEWTDVVTTRKRAAKIVVSSSVNAKRVTPTRVLKSFIIITLIGPVTMTRISRDSWQGDYGPGSDVQVGS